MGCTLENNNRTMIVENKIIGLDDSGRIIHIQWNHVLINWHDVNASVIIR